MSPGAIVALAVGLAMDAFAVCICATASGLSRGWSAYLRLAITFGCFQSLMPLIGWLLGVQLAGWFSALDHWIAFALLVFVGVRMIRSGLKPACRMTADPSHGWTLLLLAVATSIDAFAVGISLAMLAVAILVPVVAIGVITFAISLTGAALGSRLGLRAGPRMEIAGGVLLLLIGGRILWQHLAGG